MGVKDFGKHKYRIEMGDGYIQDMFAIQNDTDSRVYEFQIFTAEGSLASATGLSLKLAVDSGDGKVIICDGVLTDSSNAIFTATLTTSQLLSSGKKKAQVMLIEGTKNLRSKTFIIDVGVSLFEGGQYGHNVIVEFEKISNTISRLDDIESSFIANATTKFNEYNSNAINKLNTYNSNHTSKLNDYNTNHAYTLNVYDAHSVSKIHEFDSYKNDQVNNFNNLVERSVSSFNSNSDSKIQEYNGNAENKTSILSNIQSDVTEKYESINKTAENINGSKSDFETKKSDFDIKYNNISNIINSENERVQAENLRQQHDEKIQKLLTEGLNAELGDYVKKEQLNTELIRKAEANHTHEEFVKINKSYVAQNCVDFNSYDGYKNLNKDIVKSSESYIPFGKIKINIPRVDKSEYKFLVEVVMSSNKTHGQFKLQSPGDTLTNWTEQFQSKWFNISEGGNVYRQVISIPKAFIQAKNYQYEYSKLELRLKVTEGVTVNIHTISVKYLSDNVEYDIDYINNEIRFTDLDIKTKELFQSVSNGKQLIASAITDKGVQTEAMSEFSVMADNIRNIKIGGMTDEDKRKISELWSAVWLCGKYFFGVDYEIYNWYDSQKNINGEHDLLSVEDIINHLYNDIVKIVEKIDLIFGKINSMKGKSVYVPNSYTIEKTYQARDSKLDAILDLVERM